MLSKITNLFPKGNKSSRIKTIFFSPEFVEFSIETDGKLYPHAFSARAIINNPSLRNTFSNNDLQKIFFQYLLDKKDNLDQQ